VLAWSETQANLLRRLASGERVNDVDWEHVVEEIADVGISQLNTVSGFLRQAMLHPAEAAPVARRFGLQALAYRA
jgi:Domain of unknown function DUF29